MWEKLKRFFRMREEAADKTTKLQDRDLKNTLGHVSKMPEAHFRRLTVPRPNPKD